MSGVLIFGASGILGTEVQKLLESNKVQYVAPSSSKLNLINQQSIFDYVSKIKPVWIINCAAWTKVDEAEILFEKACELNEIAVKEIGIAAQKFNAKVIHISTDYVFDGESSIPYLENSAANPINKYGLSKLRGEIELRRELPNAYIVRTSWLYGSAGKNFVKTMAQKSLRNEESFVVDNQVGCPTNAKDLASAILSLIEKNPPPGIYNYTNRGSCSWFEFAQRIYNLVGSNEMLVHPINSKLVNYLANRPRYSILDNGKWISAGLSELIDWRISLELSMPEILTEIN